VIVFASDNRYNFIKMRYIFLKSATKTQPAHH